MQPTKPRSRPDLITWLPFVLLGLALLALFHRLLAGEVLFWGLPSLQFYPWRALAFDELRAGRLPAWNPYVGAGAPLLANYQVAVFYPPNWLHLLLPHHVAMSVIALLHIVWAGVGMWLFVRELGVDGFGRGFSMLAYALGGYLIARFGSFPTAAAGAWLPWLFWLLHRTLTALTPRGASRNAALLGLAFGLQLLAGHAQTTWYGGVGLGLYALWRAAWADRLDPRWLRLRGLLMAGMGMVAGLALAAIQLVPTAEYLAESQRSSGLDYDTLTNLSYNLFRLPTLLSPNFYGTPADGSYLTEGIYFEDTAYVGILPLIAAIAAIVAFLRLRRYVHDVYPTLITVPFWALLALGSLLIALGKHGPVFHLLYDYVPTFDAFREPVRWLILFVFSLSVLGGIGANQWGRGPRIVYWSRLSGAGGGGIALMAAAYLVFAQPDNKNLEVLSHGIIVLGAWGAVAALLTLVRPDPATGTSPLLWRSAVLIFIAADLAWAASGLNPTLPADYYDEAKVAQPAGRLYWFEDTEYAVTFGPREKDENEDTDDPFEGYFDVSDYRTAVEEWRTVRASLLPNLNMLEDVYALSNNDPLLPGYYSQYIDLIEKQGKAAIPLLSAAGVTRVYGIAPSGWQVTAQNDVITYADAPEDLVPAENGFAWFVPEATWFAEDNALQTALSDPAWDPTQNVLLVGEKPADASTTTGTGSGQVTLLDDAATERRFRVEAESAGYLVIAQTWYPGWSAQVDGTDAPLYRANLAFQAVPVPAGESDVTLQYAIKHLDTAWQISAVAALYLVGLLLVRPTWSIPDDRAPGDGDYAGEE